jgi:hypothetical protein
MSSSLLWGAYVADFRFRALVTLPYAAVTLCLVRSCITRLAHDF